MGLFHKTLVDLLEQKMKEADRVYNHLSHVLKGRKKGDSHTLLTKFLTLVDDLDEVLLYIQQHAEKLEEQARLIKNKANNHREEIMHIKATLPIEDLDVSEALLLELKLLHADLLLFGEDIIHDEKALKKKLKD